MTSLVVTVSGVLIVAAIWHILATGRFRSKFGKMRRTLIESHSQNNQKIGFDALPPVARQFIERAGVAMSNAPRAVLLTQSAEMRMGTDKPWQKIRCEQVIAVQKPGFAWFADQRRGIVSTVRVIDAYIDGHGLLEARLLGSIPVARLDGPQADQSELMRYLAEIPWAPDAALHNSSIAWREVDERIVELSAKSNGGTARVRLLFNDNAEVVEMHADERGSTENGKMVMRPWRGRFSEYREIGGRRIPVRGEVGYVYDDGYAAYWRGRITHYALNW
ncbi:MAG: DUF6544 family protein [Woeseiaceae bacterium]|nr:DUF6544 family protein [Woeseiaceae bacterium]